MRIRRRQHPVLDQKLDVGDAARVLLDVELSGPRLGQLAPHPQAHLHDVGAQRVAMHGAGQHAAACRLEAGT